MAVLTSLHKRKKSSKLTKMAIVWSFAQQQTLVYVYNVYNTQEIFLNIQIVKIDFTLPELLR